MDRCFKFRSSAMRSKTRAPFLATRDRREMSEIVIEAINLYEARYGAAPVLEPTRES